MERMDKGFLEEYLNKRKLSVMREAEDFFGPADRAWRFGGVEVINDGNAPYICFPAGQEKEVKICISADCLSDKSHYRAEWQLRHECVHLLSPTGSRDANVLEEGMATFFQNEYKKFNILNDAYKNAEKLFIEIYSVNKNAIKEIRQYCPLLKNITKDMLLKHCDGLNVATAEYLAKPFYS